jgi:hypothetical protein
MKTADGVSAKPLMSNEITNARVPATVQGNPWGTAIRAQSAELSSQRIQHV